MKKNPLQTTFLFVSFSNQLNLKPIKDTFDFNFSHKYFNRMVKGKKYVYIL